MQIPSKEMLPIATRGYVCREGENFIYSPPKKGKAPLPSKWSLIFDTETTTDASQSLRFGTYQVRNGVELHEEGLFYDADILKADEILLLQEYAQKHGLKLLPVEQFIEDVFYGIGYAWRAKIIGFNLPFDISRLAIGHSTARTNKSSKLFKNGFTFKLSPHKYQPYVQIKHVSARQSFIQFASTYGQRVTRGQRKKGKYQPIRRGFFIDIKMLAAALTSHSYSLDFLAQALKVESPKHQTEEHGKALTKEYIEYALQDTQATWECYLKLEEMYDSHGLTQTPSHKIFSEASLGKAYLKQMGIQPWKAFQPDFPPHIIGHTMSSYYGGRSEVHIRKSPVQVLYCDFLSMYPTVCTLMGLWEFVIAQGIDWKETTAQTQQFLDNITLQDLQNPATWASLHTIIQVKPDADIFPIRAKYDGTQHTIGTNCLSSENGMWFTLADCIASKILTGKSPQVLKAYTFTPKEPQENLSPICVAGVEGYQVNPLEDDFFKTIIDLRRSVKTKMKDAPLHEKEDLNRQQQALKILANSTSYGIYIENNVEDEKEPQKLLCYGAEENPTPIKSKKFESTGMFFHPLLGTLITGAARLKLAIAEKFALEEGLDWAFCDTDSMALAKPDDMETAEFYRKAKRVQEWFTPLSPYEGKPDLLQIEDENYSHSNKGELEPLYCYAISAKRYALYNVDEHGKVILRKVSAHGLGHLIAPYHSESDTYLKGVAPWQQDFWLELIKSAINGEQPDLNTLKNFDMPAVSRYAATTPRLLKWFYEYNKGKPYKEQVKPFNFMLAMQSKNHQLKPLKPISCYEKDISKNKAF